MVDTVDIITRSRIMAGIRAKNTKPEIIIRKGLYARGYRYRIHVKELTGRPDIVFRKYYAVIFVNGCFWHSHGCHLSKLPKSNTEFWNNKLSRNKQRDKEIIEKLISSGWRVCLILECSLRGKAKANFESLLDTIELWLHSSAERLDL